MVTDKQTVMMARAEEILTEVGLPKYHWPGKPSRRGFFIINPADEKDYPFLDNVSRMIRRNARRKEL